MSSFEPAAATSQSPGTNRLSRRFVLGAEFLMLPREGSSRAFSMHAAHAPLPSMTCSSSFAMLCATSYTVVHSNSLRVWASNAVMRRCAKTALFAKVVGRSTHRTRPMPRPEEECRVQRPTDGLESTSRILHAATHRRRKQIGARDA